MTLEHCAPCFFKVHDLASNRRMLEQETLNGVAHDALIDSDAAEKLNTHGGERRLPALVSATLFLRVRTGGSVRICRRGARLPRFSAMVRAAPFLRSRHPARASSRNRCAAGA